MLMRGIRALLEHASGIGHRCPPRHLVQMISARKEALLRDVKQMPL